MKLTLSTYNGTSITSYGARIANDSLGSDVNIIDNERVNEVPAYGGKSFKPAEFDIAFALRSSSEANRQTDLETIGKLFHVRDTTLRTLVALDTNDSNTQYYIECTAVKPPVIKGIETKVKMWAADPVWKKVTAGTTNISISAGTTNGTVTNNGNVDTYPVITVAPSANGGAYVYRRHVLIYNSTPYPMNNIPIDVTGGGFDTSALVGDTTVSNQINVGAGISNSATSWAIDTPVGGGLATTGGYFYMEAEQCSYTSISGGNVNGVVRGINSTVAATHADNVVMKRSLLQADGDDIRLRVAGVDVERWLGGTVATDTTLKVWGVFDLPARAQGVLRTALGASGDNFIVFKDNQANVNALKRMPDSGLVLIENECIAYTARNAAARKLTIADNGRGVKDTTAATHAAGVTIRWIPLDPLLVFGNMTAEAPSQTDTRKPCFSLENSTNTNWRYDSADSVFTDLAGLRSGGWKPSKPKGVHSAWYTGNQATYGTDPATDMGAEIVSYLSGAIYKVETAQIHWMLNHNAGFTLNSTVGEKYKAFAGTPFPKARLQSSINGVDWVTEWTENAPGSAATWTSFTRASEAVPAGTRYLRYQFFGAVNAVADATARFEINLGSAGSAGVSFESTGVPQVTLKSQTSNADIAFTLTNNTTGDVLSYAFPLAANTTLTIDTENRQVSYQNRFLAPPEFSPTRQEWFRLVPGSNSITYVDATSPSGTLSFVAKDRKNV